MGSNIYTPCHSCIIYNRENMDLLELIKIPGSKEMIKQTEVPQSITVIKNHVFNIFNMEIHVQ